MLHDIVEKPSLTFQFEAAGTGGIVKDNALDFFTILPHLQRGESVKIPEKYIVIEGATFSP